MAYAQQTTVSVGQTRNEIETILRKAGAARIVTMDEPLEAVVMFMLTNRLIRFTLPFAGDASDRVRRSRWRALLLTVKAKREAVESGIETVEQAWLSHVVLPNGQTMGEWAEPQLRVAYDKGEMPANPLMLAGPGQ